MDRQRCWWMLQGLYVGNLLLELSTTCGLQALQLACGPVCVAKRLT